MNERWSKRLQARSKNGIGGFATVSVDGGEIQLTVGNSTRDGAETYRHITLTANMAVDLAHELEQAAGKVALAK